MQPKKKVPIFRIYFYNFLCHSRDLQDDLISSYVRISCSDKDMT